MERQQVWRLRAAVFIGAMVGMVLGLWWLAPGLWFMVVGTWIMVVLFLGLARVLNNLAPSVSQSVCQSVSDKSSHTSCH